MKFKVNQYIPLVLQLSDEDTSLFPQVVIRDNTGVLIGSPIDLTHVGSGLYTNSSFQMPTNSFITMQYKVYQDAGHTIRSLRHVDTIVETVSRDFVGEAVDSILSSINALLSGGFIGDIAGFIVDQGLILGIIEDDNQLVGNISDNNNLVGIIEDDELLGYVFSDELLVGYISC